MVSTWVPTIVLSWKPSVRRSPLPHHKSHWEKTYLNREQVKTEIAPEVLELINNFSERAQSGTIGIMGSLILLAIGIQVLISIEKSFNTIWGVAKGRKLPDRIVTYWTFITLGAVLGTAAITIITANALLGAMEVLPFGETSPPSSSFPCHYWPS